MSAEFTQQVKSQPVKPVTTGVEPLRPSPVAKADGAGNVAVADASQSTGQQDSKSKMSGPELSQMVSHLNDFVQQYSRELKFSVDEESGETIIRVVDQKTGELIRQIPSEDMVELSKKMDEAAGLILKVQA